MSIKSTEHEMKERPILFKAEMVRAILDGTKTQTRRIMKGVALDWLESALFITTFVANPDNGLCPYGKIGDRLWVKETFYAYGKWVKNGLTLSGKQRWRFNDKTLRFGAYRYIDNPPEVIEKGRGGDGWYKRPSLFMPRVASRIVLEVNDERAERLNDISEADAIAEGIERGTDGLENLFRDYGGNKQYSQGKYALNRTVWVYPVTSYKSIWESINGAGSWALNPWVWVVEFKRI